MLTAWECDPHDPWMCLGLSEIELIFTQVDQTFTVSKRRVAPVLTFSFSSRDEHARIISGCSSYSSIRLGGFTR